MKQKKTDKNLEKLHMIESEVTARSRFGTETAASYSFPITTSLYLSNINFNDEKQLVIILLYRNSIVSEL
jgi:hypothetical protein